MGLYELGLEQKFNEIKTGYILWQQPNPTHIEMQAQMILGLFTRQELIIMKLKHTTVILPK